jgi:hypothetical protein
LQIHDALFGSQTRSARAVSHEVYCFRVAHTPFGPGDRKRQDPERSAGVTPDPALAQGADRAPSSARCPELVCHARLDRRLVHSINDIRAVGLNKTNRTNPVPQRPRGVPAWPATIFSAPPHLNGRWSGPERICRGRQDRHKSLRVTRAIVRAVGGGSGAV